jgi:hypothetical protein
MTNHNTKTTFGNKELPYKREVVTIDQIPKSTKESKYRSEVTEFAHSEDKAWKLTPATGKNLFSAYAQLNKFAKEHNKLETRPCDIKVEQKSDGAIYLSKVEKGSIKPRTRKKAT